jgi:hypothetical protein
MRSLKNDPTCSLSNSQRYYYKTISQFEILTKADDSEVLAKKCYSIIRRKKNDNRLKDLSRYFILEVATVERIFDLLFQIHCISNGHCGINKTTHLVNQRYACVSRAIIQKFINLCSICNMKHTQTVQPRKYPIRSHDLWQGTQIDLIDMRHNKCYGFQYICHLEDHFLNSTFYGQ